MKSLSRVRLFATPWTAAYQAPLSMGFSRQEYWNGVPLKESTGERKTRSWAGLKHTQGSPRPPIRGPASDTANSRPEVGRPHASAAPAQEGRISARVQCGGHRLTAVGRTSVSLVLSREKERWCWIWICFGWIKGGTQPSSESRRRSASRTRDWWTSW